MAILYTLDMDSLNYGYQRDGSGQLLNNRLNHVKYAIVNLPSIDYAIC